MLEVLVIVVEWVIAIGAVIGILAWDDRRMTEAQRARAWPPATRLSAVGLVFVGGVPFAFLGVAIHYWRTRRGVSGCLLALAIAIVLPATLVALIVLFGDPSE